MEFNNMLPNIILLLFLVLLPSVASSSAAKKTSSGGQNFTQFVLARCGATRYPDLCFTSLSGYAAAVQQSPVQLAVLASNVTLANLRSLLAYVAAVRRSAGREAPALRDCTDSLGSAADQVGRTAKELGRLQSTDVKWRVSNFQTWMSAALTDEDTCSSSFQDVGGTSAVKTDVCRRVEKAKEYTSNALALVNNLVYGRR